MHPMLIFGLASLGALLALAFLLTLLSRSGPAGRKVCDFFAKAPALDLVVFLFTHGPWVAAATCWWRGTGWHAWGARSVLDAFAWLGVAILAQGAALLLWSWGHEFLHRAHTKGPRIVGTLNNRVGWARNHFAVWWTSLAVPVFTLVRIAELVVYPPLVWMIRLPRYRMGEWVNVSRQKFEGLVGYDLIWCLYCDWMTGVWSLGTEMLRNIESFWCPIRFSSPEKCANCTIDFPDIDGGWVPQNGTMQDVAKALEQHYPGPNGTNAWFGHLSRKNVPLTIQGKPADTK